MPKCGYTRYSKHKGLCPNCGNCLVLVDGRLRKVVGSLTKPQYMVSFATCDVYTTPTMYSVQVIIGFVLPYDNNIFQDLPEHFEFITDRYGYQPPYSLSYVLNHSGSKMSMLLYECCGDPFRHKSAEQELKKAINDLYKWAKDIEEHRWFVYKLAGYL